MAEPYISQIIMFGGNFAIRQYAECNGQLIAISQNQALFSLIGTTYGGDGVNSFGLPDLRGRVPISFGQGPGLQRYRQGDRFGAEDVTLLALPGVAHDVLHDVGADRTLDAIIRWSVERLGLANGPAAVSRRAEGSGT